MNIKYKGKKLIDLRKESCDGIYDLIKSLEEEGQIVVITYAQWQELEIEMKPEERKYDEYGGFNNFTIGTRRIIKCMPDNLYEYEIQ